MYSDILSMYAATHPNIAGVAVRILRIADL